MHEVDLELARRSAEGALWQSSRAVWLHRLGDERVWLILDHLLEAADLIKAARWEICTLAALPGGSSLFPGREFERFALQLELARSSWEPEAYLDILLLDADAPLHAIRRGLSAILESESEGVMGHQTPVRAPLSAVDRVVAS